MTPALLHRAATLLLGTALAAALAPLPAHAAGGDVRASDPIVATQILVRLRSSAALPALLQRHRLTLQAQFGARPIYRLGVVGGADGGDTIEALRAQPDVISAEPNRQHRSPEARKNTAWTIGSAAAYAAQWAPAALRLQEAHARSTGVGMRVAVLDTGIDAAHPVFAGRLLPGFDFVDFDADPSEVGSAAASASFGHGTHVAGLVALAAPGAKIMPLRVLDADGAGNAWVLGEALLHAVDPDRNAATDDGAQVINLSLGSLDRTQLLDTLSRLVACSIPAVAAEPADDFSDAGFNDDKQRCDALGGAVIVAAAGNDGVDDVRQYPAAEGAYGLLAVAASDSTGRLAAFSNFGSWVDVAAPGEGITSALPGGGYGTWSGTSMAAPLASATAALVRADAPQLSAREVARRLQRDGAALCGSKLRRIDAAAALQLGTPVPTACR
jgi:subtilisin family serine protease